MNKENASKLWKRIQQAGDELQGKLPDHPNHPKGRNPINECDPKRTKGQRTSISDARNNHKIRKNNQCIE